MPTPYFAFRCLLLWLLVFGSVCRRTQAQHQADTWYFGQGVGWDFRGGAPAPLLDSRMTTIYASATISDPQTGELLFYSNGEQVWNRAHQLMPHGDSLEGTRETGQGALIVPVPGQTQQYYLFTLRQRQQFASPSTRVNGVSQLFYSLVDMRLQGGVGDMVPARKNMPLAGHLTEKLIAVPHANGRDYWVLVHEWGSSTFLVYGISAAGVAPPTRQRVGPAHPVVLADTVRVAGVAGQLQASPDGHAIACAVLGEEQPLSLFAFDAATGTLTHQASLGSLVDAYGVCFSPDNSKLYVQNYSRTPDGKNFNVLSQYDLRAGDSAAIRASGQSIVVGNPLTNVRAATTGNFFYLLQNGPDGRLYGASNYTALTMAVGEGLQTFFVIGQPNARGFACQLQYQRFAAFGNRRASDGGLPNFMQSYFNGLEPTSPTPCRLESMEVFPNPTADVLYLHLPGACPQVYTLTVYNSLGQRIWQEPIAAATIGDQAVDLRALAAGVYIVELQGAHKRLRKKVVKY